MPCKLAWSCKKTSVFLVFFEHFQKQEVVAIKKKKKSLTNKEKSSAVLKGSSISKVKLKVTGFYYVQYSSSLLMGKQINKQE